MIKIENAVFPSDAQWAAVVMGVRSPYASWEKSDSKWVDNQVGNVFIPKYQIGEADFNLMKRLAFAGDDHGKFLRMLPVTCSINAPFYFWKQLDTYKIGTVTDSCSTMHSITKKAFEPEDFSIDNPKLNAETVCNMNMLLDDYNAESNPEKKKKLWLDIIQVLPEGYNQTRTWSGNYQVLRHMYHARKGHKLQEWHDFCRMIETFPNSELITGRLE